MEVFKLTPKNSFLYLHKKLNLKIQIISHETIDFHAFKFEEKYNLKKNLYKARATQKGGKNSLVESISTAHSHATLSVFIDL